jgi:tRNA (guanosine-2'-O-)-methyltransferase
MSVENLIQEFGTHIVIDRLSDHLTDRRKERIEEVLLNRIASVHVAVEAPYDYHNALAIVRSAEAMGMNNVHIISSELRKNQGKKTAGGTKNWVNINHYSEFPPFYEKIRSSNMLLAGATPIGDTPIDAIPVDKPICLLLGNEQRGLSDEAMEACDILYSIPMYGVAESFNLSVSGAISLYDVSTRRRAAMNHPGDLSDKEALLEKARYYVRTLGYKLSSAILKTR